MTSPLNSPAFDGALCAQADPEAFFTTDPLIESVAVMICGLCPAREACLDYAMAHDVQGTFGGTTYSERNDVRAFLDITPEPVSAVDFIPGLRRREEELELARAVAALEELGLINEQNLTATLEATL